MSNEAAIAPLSLTDEELDCVMRAAAPLQAAFCIGSCAKFKGDTGIRRW
jgi:hypothetical protein